MNKNFGYREKNLTEKKNQLCIALKCLKIAENEIVGIEYRLGCICVFTRKYFYKIDIFNGSIYRDLNKRKLMYEVMPVYIGAYDIVNNYPVCVRNELLYLYNPNKEDIFELIREFRRHGKKVTFDYTEYLMINLGLRELRKIGLNCNEIKSLRVFFRRSHGCIVHKGIVHGDFHRLNIMKNKENHIKLIDFDCVRNDDIQEIDILYYVLFEMVYIHNMYSWFKEWYLLFVNPSKLKSISYISEFIEENNIKLLWIVLFLERLVIESMEISRGVIIRTESDAIELLDIARRMIKTL